MAELPGSRARQRRRVWMTRGMIVRRKLGVRIVRGFVSSFEDLEGKEWVRRGELRRGDRKGTGVLGWNEKRGGGDDELADRCILLTCTLVVPSPPPPKEKELVALTEYIRQD